MKYLVPALAILCFTLAGLGCKSTSCCGSCGGDDAKPACCGKCK